MKKLKKLFENLGFENVLTYINSGNIIFESTENISEKMVQDIEYEFEKEF